MFQYLESPQGSFRTLGSDAAVAVSPTLSAAGSSDQVWGWPSVHGRVKQWDPAISQAVTPTAALDLLAAMLCNFKCQKHPGRSFC